MKPTEILRQAVQKAVGNTFNEDIFQKALLKAKRWMVNAYGSVDYSNFIGECGEDAVLPYYEETLKVPDGVATSNRQNYLSTRKDLRGAK
jgi:hypothetical protein